jgi:hypothetical protein
VKGGTLIAEGVTALATHEAHMRSGAYRPERCLLCGVPVHIHDHRPRTLVASEIGSTDVARFRCADREACGAVFLVLPAFIARHLWRAWPTVELTMHAPEDGDEKPSSPVPARTASRWKARLMAEAAALIVALATMKIGPALAEKVGLGGTRAEAVVSYASVVPAPPRRGLLFASLAGLLHRAAPGLRLM